MDGPVIVLSLARQDRQIAEASMSPSDRDEMTIDVLSIVAAAADHTGFTTNEVSIKK